MPFAVASVRLPPLPGEYEIQLGPGPKSMLPPAPLRLRRESEPGPEDAPSHALFSAVLILVRLAKLKTFACPDISVWSLDRDSKILYTRLARSLDRINRDPRRRMLDRRLASHSTFNLW